MLRELAEVFIDPLFLFFFTLAVAYVLTLLSPRARRISFITIFIIFYILSTPKLADLLLKELELYPPLTFTGNGASRMKGIDQVKTYDAIVVLSGKAGFSYAYGHRELGDETIRRLLYGIYLHKKTGIPMLLTGGQPPWLKHSLASMMDRFVWRHEEFYARWLEEKAMTTDENAKYSWAILAPMGKKRVVLVTDAWHMRRSVMAFEHYGFTVLPASVGYHFANQPDTSFRQYLPHYDSLEHVYYWFHELVGRIYYQVHYHLGYTNKKDIS